MKAGNSGSDGEVSNFHLEVNPYWVVILTIEEGTGPVVGCNINLRRCLLDFWTAWILLACGKSEGKHRKQVGQSHSVRR